MSVDVFGRTLFRAREVHQGPPGIGFNLTDDGNFDLENHKLCNVACAIDLTDAVNLKNLKFFEEKFNESLLNLEKKFNESLVDLEKKFKSELNGLKTTINDKTVYVKDYYFSNKNSVQKE